MLDPQILWQCNDGIRSLPFHVEPSVAATNDSGYIRDLIRPEQERAGQLKAVRVALIEGENSGTPQVFDAQAFKQQMRATHG